MYSVTVKKRLNARHFLTIPGCGPENREHAHRYRVAVRLEGRRLDRNGYLVDISDVDRRLQDLIARYRGTVLNELPEFRGRNPSVEHLARLLCCGFMKGLRGSAVSAVTVTVAESDNASASYRRETGR